MGLMHNAGKKTAFLSGDIGRSHRVARLACSCLQRDTGEMLLGVI